MTLRTLLLGASTRSPISSWTQTWPDTKVLLSNKVTVLSYHLRNHVRDRLGSLGEKLSVESSTKFQHLQPAFLMTMAYRNLVNETKSVQTIRADTFLLVSYGTNSLHNPGVVGVRFLSSSSSMPQNSSSLSSSSSSLSNGAKGPRTDEAENTEEGEGSHAPKLKPKHPRTSSSSWDEMFTKLLIYRDRYGDCHVPTARGVTKTLDVPRGLIDWVSTIRTNYMRGKIYPREFIARQNKKNGNDYHLTPERVATLDTIGFLWRVQDALWHYRYNQLVSYAAHHNGDTQVPVNYEPNPPLGRWVASQRKHCSKLMRQERMGIPKSYTVLEEHKPEVDMMKRNNNDENDVMSPLTPKRIGMLNEIHFVWDTREKTWMDTYEELKRYRDEYGDVHVPNNYVTRNGLRLGWWVHRQRRAYEKIQRKKKNAVTTEKNSIINDGEGGRGRKGSLSPPQSGNTLTPERINRLNLLGFIWDLNDAEWEERFSELRRFHEKHGHSNALLKRKSNGENDPNAERLAGWVKRQRDTYEQLQQLREQEQERLENDENKPILAKKLARLESVLTPHRIHKLTSLDFIFDKGEVKWRDKYDLLKLYHSRHGHCDVRATSVDPEERIELLDLISWIKIQRAQYKSYLSGKKTNITSRRIDLLNQLGFIWDLPDDSWQRYYNELCNFKARHGHCVVPRSHPSLGLWVNRQRLRYRKVMLYGDRSGFRKKDDIDDISSRSRKRLDLLNEVGFVWDVAENNEWMKRFQELKEASWGEKRSLDVKMSNPELASWMEKQREECRKMKEGELSLMNEDRLSALSSLGFIWHYSCCKN